MTTPNSDEPQNPAAERLRHIAENQEPRRIRHLPLYSARFWVLAGVLAALVIAGVVVGDHVGELIGPYVARIMGMNPGPTPR
jgi:hypothetical protein